MLCRSMESLVCSRGALDIKRLGIFGVSAGRYAVSELFVGDCDRDLRKICLGGVHGRGLCGPNLESRTFRLDPKWPSVSNYSSSNQSTNLSINESIHPSMRGASCKRRFINRAISHSINDSSDQLINGILASLLACLSACLLGSPDP